MLKVKITQSESIEWFTRYEERYPEGILPTLAEAVIAARKAAQRIIDSFKPTT